MQGLNKSAVKPKRCSLDLQDILMNSTSWLPVGSPGLNRKEDDKDSVSGDWVDKVMVNKHDSTNGNENPVDCWEVDKRQSPEMFGQSYIPVPSKIYPEQAFSNLMTKPKGSQDYDVPNGRYETATDDSDELEVATSDSSEQDMLWQPSLPKPTKIPNGLGSKTKKTNPKSAKSIESRSVFLLMFY